MRLTQLVLSTSLVLSLVACRGGGDDAPGDDTVTPDAPPVGGTVTIMEVQNDAMAPGTQVTVKGVVVTAIDAYGARTGDFFVQDPAGGPFSGIKVFGAPLEVIATLAPGDLVDISNAEKDEFTISTVPGARTVTELKPVEGATMTVVKKGTSAVPTPIEVDAKAIGAMERPAREAEWEKYEGVLIKVTGARQLRDTETFGTNPGPDSNEFRITGIARVQSVLADLPPGGVGECYASITGVGDFFFDDLVLPRSAADLVSGGTDCNPMATTIAQLQTGTPVELVSLTNVFVVAVSSNKKNLWISSSLTAAPNDGVYVFRGNQASTTEIESNVVVGAMVNVAGVGVEFNNDQTGETVTQLTGPKITVTAAPTTGPVPVAGQTAASLTMAVTGEPYESVLVTLTNVKVTTLGNNFGVGSLTQYPGATVFKSDDDIHKLSVLDACYASITGVWSYSPFENSYIFLPLSAGMTPGSCN
ncbi:MAG: hypothetical protein M3680_07815 [Myxococcota bacterium]|nr:hypothetical protein [Myxococcota bacterium]